MAIQERPALTDRVYDELRSLHGTDSKAVGPDTELEEIGFDSLAAAELSAVVEREFGIDLVDAQLAGLRRAREVAELVEETAAVERGVRETYPRGMGRMQRTAKVAAGPFSRWWFALEVVGAEHVPP